jgi:hypothetical protein
MADTPQATAIYTLTLTRYASGGGSATLTGPGGMRTTATATGEAGLGKVLARMVILMVEPPRQAS